MSGVTRRPTRQYLAMIVTGSNAADAAGHRLSRTPRPLAGSGLSPSARRLAAAVVLAVLAGAASAETWRGLTIAPEHRCSPYDRKRDYPYPQSVEQDIVRALGAVCSPTTANSGGGCNPVVTATETPTPSRWPCAKHGRNPDSMCGCSTRRSSTSTSTSSRLVAASPPTTTTTSASSSRRWKSASG